MGILRRTERAICGAKVADRKNTEDMMDMLDVNQTIDKMAKARGVRWLRHIWRKEDGDIVRNVLEFNVEGRREDRKERGESKQKSD